MAKQKALDSEKGDAEFVISMLSIHTQTRSPRIGRAQITQKRVYTKEDSE